MPDVTFKVDVSDVVDGLNAVPEAIRLANISAVALIREELRSIILGSLELAFDEAGAGFPEIYKSHLRLGILKATSPEVYATLDGIVVRVYDIEDLGDYEELEQGFHYHALLDVDKSEFSVSNPQRVELPYSGEELENPFEERYAFWLAVVSGTDFDVTFGGGKDKRGRATPKWTKPIVTAGLYQETLSARVHFWGDRYPEWLVLEYGTEYEPVVPPTHFKYLMETRIQEYLDEVYESIINSVLDVWDEPEVAVNSAGRLINAATGRFVPYLPRG